MYAQRLKDILNSVNRIILQNVQLYRDGNYYNVTGINIDNIHKRVNIICSFFADDDTSIVENINDTVIDTDFMYNALCINTKYFDVYIHMCDYATGECYCISELTHVHVHFEHDTIALIEGAQLEVKNDH